MEGYRDDADAADDLEHRPDLQAPETPEADALEQAAELDDAADDEADAVGDAPEADALEQHRPAGGDADADERR
jgi:hypothetical protein